MVRQVGQVSYNTFVKGLITEAGPLTFPDNATIEDMNCVLTLKGSHRRRYGISEDANGRELDLYDDDAERIKYSKDLSVNTYLWKAPDNKGTLNFLVIQINTKLYFFSMSEQHKEFSYTPSLITDLSSYIVDKKLFLNNQCSFISAKGFLFVAGSGLQPFKVIYNSKNDTLETKEIEVLIRDTDGVDDGLAIERQPAGALSDLHKYNLYNQGWLYPRQLDLSSSNAAGSINCENFDFRCRVANFSFYIGDTVFFRASFYDDDNNSAFPADAGELARLWNTMPEAQRFGFTARREGHTVYFDKVNKNIPTPKGTLRFRLEYKIKSKNREVNAYGVLGGGGSLDTFPIDENTPIGKYYEHCKRYPSNVQQWFVGREVKEDINVEEVESFDFGSQPAPKGRFIIDAFTLNRDLYISSIPKASDSKRATDIAFLSGRMFYLKDNQVFFSQVLTYNTEREGRCYQEGDPTSENAFDLVDSDGGVIQINDMGEAVALFEMSNGLIVFANNGLWVISGLSEDEGFKATSFAIRKLSSLGCISRKSIVDVEGFPIFWSTSGIYTIQRQELGGLQVVSLSANTIQSLYKDIPLHNLRNVKGVYDKGSQKIYWLYDVTENENVIANRYTRGLVLDVRLQAFYEMAIASDSSFPYICCSFNTPWLESINFNQEIVDNEGELVLDNSGEILYTRREVPNSSLTDVKFLAYQVQPDGTLRFTVCAFNDTSFTDWKRQNKEGLAYESYFTTGYNIAGESDSTKDIVYLTTQLSRTEDAYDETSLANRSSCQMQIRWDYENTSYSGKWTKPVQIYRANRLFAPTLEDPNYDHRGLPVVTTKHKVRGNGKAIQIKFTSEPGKNFEVLGWSMILGNRK